MRPPAWTSSRPSARAPGCGTSTGGGSSTASPRRARSTSDGETRASSRPPTPPSTTSTTATSCSARSQKAELAAKPGRDHAGRLSCTMFGTGGGEAIDFAIKLARGRDRAAHDHLDASTATTATPASRSRPAARASFREPFEPLMPGVRPGALRRPRGARRGDRRAHRGGPARTDPGRGRHRRAAAGLPRRRARGVRPRRGAADPRRDPDRPRAHRASGGRASTSASCPTS